MSAAEALWHAWEAALAELCPGVRATRRRGWLLLALGIALAGSCAVGRAAGARPGRPASVRSGRGLARERVPGPGRHGAGGASAACGSPATGCAKRSTTATSRPSPLVLGSNGPRPSGFGETVML